MALQKFRDKQKIIYWIVAIIVIPSFMIFGYSQVFDFNPSNDSVGIIDGKSYSNQEYSDFYQRLRALNPETPIAFGFSQQNYFFPQITGSEAMFNILALKDKAIACGLIVTDEEVATYIRGQFSYAGQSEKELENIIKQRLEQTSRLKSIYEYKLAVREWLLAKKFLNIIDRSLTFPSAVADISNTMQQTTITYGSLVIPVSNFTTKATDEYNKLTESELKAKAQDFINTYQKPEYRSTYNFLWTDPKWKLEYIAVPLITTTDNPEVSTETLEKYYNDNLDKYKDKDGKEELFAAIQDRVKEDYLTENRIKTARDTLGMEFTSFLSRADLKNDDAKTIQEVDLGIIANDPRLQERGLIVGTSADNPLTAFEIADNPVFTGSGIQRSLAILDTELQNAKLQDANEKRTPENQNYPQILERSSRSFFGQARRGADGSFSEIPYFSANKTFSKIRVTDYEEGKKRSLTAADGSELLESIKEQLIADRSKELAMAAAASTSTALKENKKEIDGREVITQTTPYRELFGDLTEIGNTPTGETVGPIFSEDVASYAMYIIYSRDTNNAITQSTSALTYPVLSDYSRGNSFYTPEFPMTPQIGVGVRLMNYLVSQADKVYMVKDQ